MRILITIGTRPEAIKLVSLVRYLRDRPVSEGVETLAVSTGQHTDLLEMTLVDLNLRLDEVAIPISFDRTLPTLLSSIIQVAADQVRRYNPDLLIVQGDTASALGSALAAFNMGVPICHIEAGLRSFRQWEPYPEEMNRRLLSKLASFHFATTANAKANLIQEGIEPVRIFPIQNPIRDSLELAMASLAPLSPPESRKILITLHRREDRQERLQALFAAIHEIARAFPDVTITFVWHPALDSDRSLFDALKDIKAFRIIPPAAYREFIKFLTSASVVVTDSGGTSEEAALLGIPLVVFRRITEREDLVQDGCGVPVGIHAAGLIEAMAAGLEHGWKVQGHDIRTQGVGRVIGRTIIDIVLPSLGELEIRDLR